MKISFPHHNAIIIDDEEAIVEVLKAQMDGMNLFKHVVSANDGLIALTKLQNQEFSLIILDLNLPKKNGMDILAKLIAENKSYAKKILVISGDLVKNSLELMLKLGVKNFLVKPFDKKVFESKVKEILEKEHIDEHNEALLLKRFGRFTISNPFELKAV